MNRYLAALLLLVDPPSDRAAARAYRVLRHPTVEVQLPPNVGRILFNWSHVSAAGVLELREILLADHFDTLWSSGWREWGTECWEPVRAIEKARDAWQREREEQRAQARRDLPTLTAPTRETESP